MYSSQIVPRKQRGQCDLELETGHWWDVHRFAFPFGHQGRRLGRVRAPTRRAAEQIAHGRYGTEIIVTLAGGGKTRMRRDSIGRPLHRGNRGRR